VSRLVIQNGLIKVVAFAADFREQLNSLPIRPSKIGVQE
jgi:hypothetical protein